MKPISINIDMSVSDIDVIRVIVNGKEYQLIPTSNSEYSVETAEVPTFVQFVDQLVGDLKKYGRRRTAETYRSAKNSFLRFIDGDDFRFSQFTTPLICDYEKFLKGRGLCSNSSSFYMRVLRTIYLRAVDSGYVNDTKPFVRVYTGIGKTVKRAITIDEIRRIRHLKGLTYNEELARDLFLFSFYTRGMSFIDIAYLKPENIQNGLLTYQRQKTGQLIAIRWEQPMQDIVNRHPTNNSKYLLPIILRNNGCERSQYRECQRIVNVELKKIGRLCEISLPLTMYVARHSWASIARGMNLPVGIISDAMGHTSEHTTQVYLKTLDTAPIDNANADIIRAAQEPDSNSVHEMRGQKRERIEINKHFIF